MSEMKVWARRAAHALVQSAGTNTVALRMPAAAGATDADELGIVASAWSEVPLWPVMVRTSARGTALLVSAEVLHAALSLEDAHAVKRALQECEGVSIAGAWMFVRAVEVREVGGEPYLYRMELVATEGSA
ncbi:MAG: hypothetical protein JSS87_01845 [Acidobacteria bacterium]|nr:hypothetical protein [Acidobacteriota bacterium]